MINIEALHRISYGLYIVSSGDKQSGNGFISNTVFQVSSDPIKFAVCCNKDNFTSDIIKRTGSYAVSVPHRDTESEIFGHFGFKSGKNFDKIEGMKVIYGNTGVPIILNDCIAWLECKVDQVFDVGSHLIIIGLLVNSEVIDESKEPITYSYYRQIKKGFAPKNAPTYINKLKLGAKQEVKPLKKYKCSVCGYIYDEASENVRFEELPADWICPVCGSPKSEFNEIEN
jgi:flavin reductase (DIM6/NTAB) family NADH-FMN oxidoreductase RutF/rubredoxin